MFTTTLLYRCIEILYNKSKKNCNRIQSTTIEQILHLSKEVLGCFPLDKLPSFPTKFQKCIIINTHKS